MNKSSVHEVRTAARHLRAGDVLGGSGFVVTHNAYAGVSTPKGKVEVEGYYPGSEMRRRWWNASTTVSVIRRAV